MQNSGEDGGLGTCLECLSSLALDIIRHYHYILRSKELLHFIVKAAGSPHNFSYSFRDRQSGHVMIDMTVVLRNVGQCSYYYCILNILSDWLRANLYKSENCGNMKRSADIL